MINDLDYIFDFGKHKGKTLRQVWIEDIHYIDWCIDNVSWFVLDTTLYDALQEDLYEDYRDMQCYDPFWD